MIQFIEQFVDGTAGGTRPAMAEITASAVGSGTGVMGKFSKTADTEASAPGAPSCN